MSWKCLKQDTSMGGIPRKVYLLGDAEEIGTSPEEEESAWGSLAFTVDMASFWVRAEDGSWTESTSDALALIGLMR